MLMETPVGVRNGPDGKLPGVGGRTDKQLQDSVGRKISENGKKSGIKVQTHPETGKVKYASAHDLRRAFGERWAALVMPAHLEQLMWYESIETTLRYYVGANADRTNDICWEACEHQVANRSSRQRATSVTESPPEINQQNLQQDSANPFSRP